MLSTNNQRSSRTKGLKLNVGILIFYFILRNALDQRFKFHKDFEFEWTSLFFDNA